MTSAGPLRGLVVLVALCFAFTLVMCGGGSGADKEGVTVSGVVSAEGQAGGLADAHCRFVDLEGQAHDSDLSTPDGHYRLRLSSGLQGYVLCHPRELPNLKLSTYLSTVGIGAGSRISNEAVTPATTLTADIIRQEAPPNAQIRKAELLGTIAAGLDPDLDLLVTVAERLYGEMLSRRMNTPFGNDGGDRGDGDDGDDGGIGGEGGVSGEAGDGADFSPLPGAECQFVVGADFASAEPLERSALADLLTDGELDRPDLEALAETVFGGLPVDAEAFKAAIETHFPHGLDAALSTFADEAGRYFLPVPPDLAGYVRCTPADRNGLVLGAYVPGRSMDETLVDQDVNPATTVFSALIAPRVTSDLDGTLANYLADIDGLETLLVRQADDRLAGFRLGTDTRPANDELGLVAFSATALFNALYKNDLDADFSTLLAELTQRLRVDPASLRDQGVPAAEVQTVADLVNRSIDTTANDLGTDLATALASGRLKVQVRSLADGSPIAGAVVDIAGDGPCQGCGARTEDDGVVELTLAGLTASPVTREVRVSGVPGYPEKTLDVPATALVTLNVPVYLGAEVAPRVVATEPPDGATDVPVTLEWLSVRFDQPMEGGYRVLADLAWDLSGDTDAYWSDDKRVFFISRTNPGTPLPADTGLTVVLNPPPIEEPDFRNRADVVMETYTFSFTTGVGP